MNRAALLIAFTLASAARGQAPAQAAGCGPLSLSQMSEIASHALSHVNDLASIPNRLARTAAAQVTCASVDSADARAPEPTSEATPEQCLGAVFSSAVGAKCTGACGESVARLKSTLASVCARLGGIGCKPKLCARLTDGATHAVHAPLRAAVPSGHDALVGCFDVRSSKAARDALSAAFTPPFGQGVSSLGACAAACADSIQFAMEGGRCRCGQGVMTAWPQYAASPSQCGSACAGDRDGAGMPCGRLSRVAVYDTAAIVRGSAVAASSARAEATAREQDGARSSALLAAAALGSAAVAIVRAARTASDGRRARADVGAAGHGALALA
ncbi:hypothetical protein KFE25_004094 [Diacronema lutheri]|uniref:WSC domain-containing protein n=1 Tax=Diacronema lutheri TaxID=2081491 RepID=A0A8J6CA85_DIALT|nr:hypothetical protein KFE25_004094 [Diacronema lutheri]|mmetsp:Transcript_6845/g.21597  ORF Transcript_6845/g.21597 Transcript_6845/m.21597 type:complete len:329 (+) Transcript_6845:71-1057(+)